MKREREREREEKRERVDGWRRRKSVPKEQRIKSVNKIVSFKRVIIERGRGRGREGGRGEGKERVRERERERERKRDRQVPECLHKVDVFHSH